MWPNAQFPADFVKFTEEIFNGNIHFLRNANTSQSEWHFLNLSAVNQV